MSKKDKLRTEARIYGWTGPFGCYLCGEPGEVRHCGVRLMDPETSSTAWRTICPTCVDAGPAGAAERLRARAKGEPLRERRRLLRLAERVAKIDGEDWATARDLQAAQVQYTGRYRPVTIDKPHYLPWQQKGWAK